MFAPTAFFCFLLPVPPFPFVLISLNEKRIKVF